MISCSSVCTTGEVAELQNRPVTSLSFPLSHLFSFVTFSHSFFVTFDGQRAYIRHSDVTMATAAPTEAHGNPDNRMGGATSF